MEAGQVWVKKPANTFSGPWWGRRLWIWRGISPQGCGILSVLSCVHAGTEGITKGGAYFLINVLFFQRPRTEQGINTNIVYYVVHRVPFRAHFSVQSGTLWWEIPKCLLPLSLLSSYPVNQWREESFCIVSLILGHVWVHPDGLLCFGRHFYFLSWSVYF